ncbi:MAG TPA: allantoinase [bacterium]|nr:allantoinase [bacterium]
MAKLRLVKREHTLIYGMRLLPDRILAEGEHEHVPLPAAGPEATLTLHVITGDKEQIKRRLLQSVDAFFEIYAEELP